MYGTVSVVVPVYNVEKYIKECLDSIVNQTYKNLQIILVDDGSTDRSGIICDEYAKNDNRITVIHQKNAGAGAAKNAGLEYVKGEYLSLIDSDDYIELNMYEKMLSYMVEKKVDVVQCSFNNYFANGKIKTCFDDKRYSTHRFLKEYPYKWQYAIFWNKLFKFELLTDICFPVSRKIDDEFFTYKLIANAKNIYTTSETFYNYRMRSSSVMNENKKDILISDRVDCFNERYEFMKAYNKRLGKYYYEHLSDILLFYKTQATGEELQKKLDDLIRIYPYKKPSILKRLLKKKNKMIKVSSDNDFILFD